MNCDIGSNVKGVYLIRNKVNGRCYIGSSINVRRRILEHFRSLEQNNHHSMSLQVDFNKYGIENFQVEVLIECSISDARKYEEEYIAKFNLKEFGYNQGQSREASKAKYKFFKHRLFDLLKKLGYKSDGNIYWFDIFEISKLLKLDATLVLKNFGINAHKRWNVTIDVDGENFVALNYDNENGVQIIAFHKNNLKLNWLEYENIYIDEYEI